MAELEQRPAVTVEVVLRLSEPEARALHAITVYGSEAFLRVFYKSLGKAYLEPHEAGLLKLFDGVADLLPPILDRAREARKAFTIGLEPKVPAQHTPARTP